MLPATNSCEVKSSGATTTGSEGTQAKSMPHALYLGNKLPIWLDHCNGPEQLLQVVRQL
jgi:hypothetical protein